MLAIILGAIIRNVFPLPPILDPGIRFGLIRVLRIGIVLLGIRLSLAEVGQIGIQSLPVIAGSVISALLIVTVMGVKLGLTSRLGTLIAVGTSICGATAIVATAPAIAARDDEVAYSVACVTIFGLAAMLIYPFAAHYLFAADPFAIGLFLGTAIHETAQVAGAGLVYQEYYNSPQALDVATVTKLVRNLSMLVVIPVVSVVYHRRSNGGAGALPPWWKMVPLFIVGFAAMSLFRTVGDTLISRAAPLRLDDWQLLISGLKGLAELCLAVAMASVGLGTSLRGLRETGARPLAVGLLSAVFVGVVSIILIKLVS
jgi:uncharacterized integral membrane protein (TIGR00698 family)